MTRRPRIVIPGWMHHVTQRGNHQQIVFYSSNDRTAYLSLCAKYFGKYKLRLIGYNLMSNHVHLAVIPESGPSLSDGCAQLHHDYAVWQNIRRQRNGHLWQNRFFSCPVEDDRIGQVLGYIEMNPVRAHMVKNAWDWEWSSARAHITGHDSSGLLDMDFWQKKFKAKGWKEYLEKTAENEAITANIRYATSKGYLMGSEETAIRLERLLGKQLRPKKRGRKPKAVIPSLKK